MSWTRDLFHHCSTIGLNVFGVADGEPYQNILPNCRSVIVIANGGSALWDNFLTAIQTNPAILTTEKHPLDTWIQQHLSHILSNLPNPQQLIRCAANDQFLDFRPLAAAAGLGHHSHMGLLIHPRYGLWISLRAALFTTEELAPTPNQGSNPCVSCPKYCAAACPGKAFDKKGWSISRCAAFHEASSVCSRSCLSRFSCPIGQEYQHPPLAHHYHSNQDSGRIALCAALGLSDHLPNSSTTPDWKRWK